MEQDLLLPLHQDLVLTEPLHVPGRTDTIVKTGTKR
uniref:Uncharacterized protein n=1 Tax=Arundo donax TaxID=35708 RepID=A0A0A9I1T1_ARUDO